MDVHRPFGALAGKTKIRTSNPHPLGDEVRAADRRRGFQDNQIARLENRRNGVDRTENRPHVRPIVGIDRGRHRDHEHLGGFGRSRRFQTLGSDRGLDDRVQQRLDDVNLALIDRVHDGLVDVDADDFNAAGSHKRRRWQTDVAKTEDTDLIETHCSPLSELVRIGPPSQRAPQTSLTLISRRSARCGPLGIRSDRGL